MLLLLLFLEGRETPLLPMPAWQGPSAVGSGRTSPAPAEPPQQRATSIGLGQVRQGPGEGEAHHTGIRGRSQAALEPPQWGVDLGQLAGQALPPGGQPHLATQPGRSEALPGGGERLRPRRGSPASRAGHGRGGKE